MNRQFDNLTSCFSAGGKIVQQSDEGVQHPKASPLQDFSYFFYSAHYAKIPACTRVCRTFCTRVCGPMHPGVQAQGVHEKT